jgi:surfactin synthase thioesterase subunit
MQRKIIEKIAAFSSSGGDTDDFYKLQNYLSNSEIRTIPICKPEEAKENVMKNKIEYDSNKIATLFSKELQQLRDDPLFTGSVNQVDYLKEILANDKVVSKVIQ